jgi:hypothetical protein
LLKEKEHSMRKLIGYGMIATGLMRLGQIGLALGTYGTADGTIFGLMVANVALPLIIGRRLIQDVEEAVPAAA